MVTRVKGSTFNSIDNFGYASILDYGGIGDGSTDNTAAFTAAFATGLPVFVPGGTFVTGSITVPTGGQIFGVGSKSVVKAKAGLSSPVITIGNGGIVKDLQIDGNKAGQSNQNVHGIYANIAVQGRITGVTITNTSGDGINVAGYGNTGIKILDCNILNYTKNGITIEDGVFNMVQGCEIWSADPSASPGIGIALAPTYSGALVSNATIVGNEIKSAKDRGIALLGYGSKNVTDCIVSQNQVYGSGSHGIHLLTTQRIAIAGNMVTSGSADGIRLEGDTVRSRVSENIIALNTGTCLREVVAGSTPDYNGLIYTSAQGNGSDTVVKVGANSFII